MKKTFGFLVAVLLSVSAHAADYPVAHGANEKITHATHYPKTVSIKGTQSDEFKIDNIASAPKCAAYFDKSSTVFEVKAGDLVTPGISINGNWMHGYVFVDWNGNGNFEVSLEGSGPYTPGEGNELMCYSHYNKTDGGNDGWNSAGEAVGGDVLAPGSFRVPKNLEVGSTYRMRYMIAWNCIDPTGNYGNFISDGGSIIDVTLKISGIAEDVKKYPIDDYDEPRVGTTPSTSEWNKIADGLHASWASRDVQHELHKVPQLKETADAEITAWKGERANLEAVLFSKSDQGKLSVRMTEAWGKARFLNYVITDDYKACGNHDFSLVQWLAPDVIDQDKPHAVPAMETRPVWVSLEVPRDIATGQHQLALEVVNEANEVVKTLNLTVNVDAHQLPEVANQKFHLDLWQQPYAVSRYYEVDRWSDEHVAALRPYLEALGKAGQKVVSTIMFYEPWGEQTHDKFSPMVQTTKKSDGTWAFDYTIFDKYVELCAEYGITEQINCYSMVPWDMSFRYFDENQGKEVDLKTTTSSNDYKNLWNSFLAAFKAHLQEKGWFEKTCIAMDERGESAMLDAYNIAKTHGFKMALAGNFHGNLNDKLYDLSLALNQVQAMSATQFKSRKDNGRLTTIYTSCADAEPNIYTNSFPAEAAYLPLHAAANDLDGYLHWAWINWDEHPLTDSRFRKFGSGDTYSYYPGNRSSVRFERLVEGIHQYEKIQIIKEEYKDDAEKMKTFNTLLDACKSYAVAGEECADKVNRLEDFLNGKKVEIPESKDVTPGYYHMVSKATARHEHLYNDAFFSGNNYQFTLQSNTMVPTNNGIWKVDVNGAKIALKNGDGHPMVAGKSYASGVMGTFSELNVIGTKDADGYRYYQFSEAPNCSNVNSGFTLNGVCYLTTWTTGGAADDNLWRFEPVETEGKFVYNVVVEGNKDAYVTLSATQEKAFDGGFFISDVALSEADFQAGLLNNIVKSSELKVEEGTVTLSNVVGMETPVRTTLFSTLAGGMDIPPYRIPGISCGKNGRLVAAAARLVCGTDPGYGQVDVVCKLSEDNGKTWSSKEIDVAVGDESLINATKNVFEAAYGDPAVVADRESDEILIMAVAGCTVYTNSNTNRSNPNMIAAIRSLDGGKTWQKPENQTEAIYSLFDGGKPMDAAFVGGGKIFQSRIVKYGKYYRIYAALAARPNGNRVIYSDDFGRTWKALGGSNATPVPNGDEPKCEELPDSRVIISSRTASGRYYNIFTYTTTSNGVGHWESQTLCPFSDLSAVPSSNPTNGELLIVPVKRNSDGQSMHLALQSIPTGSGRNNVGIFYKELLDDSDMKNVSAFCAGWDGFYQVSNTASAYSSLDLQADNKIGFFYEETLTKWGTKPNPKSTSFPTGAGQHNFDGFENIYLPIDLELITGGKYSVDREDPTGLDGVSNCKALTNGKFLEKEGVVILKDGKRYRVSGQQE